MRPCRQTLCLRRLLLLSLAVLGHLRPFPVLLAPQEQFLDSSQIKENFTQLHRVWGKRIPASLATLSSSGNQDSQVQPLPTFSEDEDEDEGLNRESSGSLLPNTVWSPLRAGGIRCSAPNGGR